MKSISGKALCKIVERQGWQLKRITGSHHIYGKEGVTVILSIPVHSDSRFTDWNLKRYSQRCWDDRGRPAINLDEGKKPGFCARFG